MANHIRRQIRDRIVTLLTGLSTTGARVYNTPVYALAPSNELPCILVYTLSEDVSKPKFCHPGEIQRSIAVAIEAVATATTGVQDTLDQVCKEVEAKLATDFYLNALAKDAIALVRTEFDFQGADTPKPIGAARMSWVVPTETLEGVPDVVV